MTCHATTGKEFTAQLCALITLTRLFSWVWTIQAVNPNVSGIFYYNSAMDWPFYRLHAQFEQHPEWWLREWPSGTVVRINGDPSFPNHTDMLSFDFAQSAVRDFFGSECINMTVNFGIDGTEPGVCCTHAHTLVTLHGSLTDADIGRTVRLQVASLTRRRAVATATPPALRATRPCSKTCR
jgi:hypothetical protein